MAASIKPAAETSHRIAPKLRCRDRNRGRNRLRHWKPSATGMRVEPTYTPTSTATPKAARNFTPQRWDR